MPRERPEVISTRVYPQDRARLRALAELEGVSVCEVLNRILVPAIRVRLAEATREPAGADQ
jgi:hypothetical protein